MSIDDGDKSHCFSCGKTARANKTSGSNERREVQEGNRLPFVRGNYEAITEWGISEETCRKFNYEVGTDRDGKRVHIANYRDDKGARVAQKLRYPNKDFKVTGDGPRMGLYGQWLWNKGKHITITEGEKDALAMSQAMNNSWPVVSLPKGAQCAAKEIAKQAEYLSKFENVVLCFDMDKPGREAVEEAARVLPPGTVSVMNLPEKDAHEVFKKLGPQRLVDCFWKAKPWRPDGIISGKELTRERLKKAVAAGYKLHLPKFDDMTFGVRKGEIAMLTAASGIGKSTWAREIAYQLHREYGLRIGNVFLEENNEKSGQAYVAIHTNVPLKFIRRDPTVITDEQWDEALAKVVHERMWFYDHFGSLDSRNLLSKLRFLATVEKVDFIILDHISIVVSGTSSDEGERKDIDVLMTKLRSLVEETGVGVISIVHVKRTGKNLNEGGQIALTDLRGSGSLEQVSDNVYALERDQQGEAGAETKALIRILKCRETGETGEADTLDYNRETGRLLLAAPFDPVTEHGSTEEIKF